MTVGKSKHRRSTLLERSRRTVWMPDKTVLIRLGECATNQEIWAVIPPLILGRFLFTGSGRDCVFLLLDSHDGTVSVHQMADDQDSVLVRIEMADDAQDMTGGFRFSDPGSKLGEFPADADDVRELYRLLFGVLRDPRPSEAPIDDGYTG